MMFITAAVVFMWFDTTPPYVFDVSQSYIVPNRAEEGMQIRVVWKVKKLNRFCPGTNTRVLFDPVTKARIAIYDPVAVASPYELDDNTELIRTFLLPRQMETGKVGYRASQAYNCNWLQHFFPLIVVTPDLFFEVIPEHASR